MALFLEVLISDALQFTTGIYTSVWKSREGFWPGWGCCEIRVPKQHYIHYLTWALPETYLKILLHACPVIQSCLTLWDATDYSLPGSFIHGIFQTRILEQVAISSFRGSSRPRDQTHVSCICFTIASPEKPTSIITCFKDEETEANRLSQCLAIQEWEQRSPWSRK